MNIANLKPGTRFQLAEMPGVTGRFLRANECRAVVQLDRQEQNIELRDSAGAIIVITKTKGAVQTSISPQTRVQPITEPVPSSPTFARVASIRSTPVDGPDAGIQPSIRPNGRMTAADAAATVLAQAGRPMSAAELITEMAKCGLWESPGGKTPAATLSATIHTEMKKAGPKSRFAKAERGMFVLHLRKVDRCPPAAL